MSCGDLEMVALAPSAEVAKRLSEVLEVRRIAGGERLITFDVETGELVIPVQIHIARIVPDLWNGLCSNYGWKLMLATGDAVWNRYMVTARTNGGLKPERLTLRDGFVWQDGHRQDTPLEERIFELWGIPYVPPPERNGERAKQLLERPSR